MENTISPRRLLAGLTVYFLTLIGGCAVLIFYNPDLLQLIPVAGNDVLEIARTDFETIENVLEGNGEIVQQPAADDSNGSVRESVLIVTYLSLSLLLTIFVMLPITWTYMATRYEIGFRKSFVRSLIVLPVCATTIVLLIQNSLSLAFGLAALVTAVRFRVALQDPIDGIYIFAAICVALAAGIGYLGIASIMAIFFCFANTVLWALDYGRNPLDEKRTAKDQAKLELPQNPG